jgi:hypothetical protein|tara:strand:- start:9349 stop:9594 length:246 start_codon:yes stop_codon:yes gene_type:complete
MTNRILVEVDEKGVVSYDLNVDNPMTMLVALVDAMNHNINLANIIDGASEARVKIRDAQKKAIEDSEDKQQIKMFDTIKPK